MLPFIFTLFLFLNKNSADHFGDVSQKILQPGADLELINSLFFYYYHYHYYYHDFNFP